MAAGGTKPPLFCMHAGAGTVLFYHTLARLLGADQPMYGLEALGTEDGRLSTMSVEAMAADCLQAIRRMQPRGPYYLAGYSFGTGQSNAPEAAPRR